MTAVATRTGVLLMLASAAAWAFGLVASKGVLDRSGASAPAVLAIQLGASAALLLVVAVVLQPRHVVPALRVGWPGLLEPGLAYLLSLLGLTLTSAANATVIASLEPVVVPVVAWVLLSYRVTRRQAVAGVGAAAGAALVAWEPGGGTGDVAGDALVLASVVAASLYVVVSASHVVVHRPLALAASQQTWALGFTTVVVAMVSVVSSVRWPTNTIDIAAIAGSGLLNYALPFALYLAALRHLALGSAAAYLATIPVFGLIAARLALGEQIALMQALGAALVVCVLVWLTSSERRASEQLDLARREPGGVPSAGRD